MSYVKYDPVKIRASIKTGFLVKIKIDLILKT